MLSLNLLLVVLIIIQTVNAFNSQINSIRRARNALSMEYIPDGLSKAQWADLKRRVMNNLKFNIYFVTRKLKTRKKVLVLWE
jgi:hypothetical protein